MIKINFDDAPVPQQPAPKSAAQPAAVPQAAGAPGLRLTAAAAARIAHIIAGEPNNSGMFLRIGVVGGGCSGFSYTFKLDTNADPTDMEVLCEEVPAGRVRIDMLSFGYLKGSTIDFEETLEASQFVIKNPNAASGCGCGSSFSMK